MEYPRLAMSISIQLSFISLAEDQTKGRGPHNKQELKVAAVKAWENITREDVKRLLMAMGGRLHAVIDCKGFSKKY